MKVENFTVSHNFDYNIVLMYKDSKAINLS